MNPKILEIFLSVGKGVLKKKMLDFSRLIVMPKALEKVESIVLKDLASWTEGCPINRLSSINCWWVRGVCLWSETPLRVPRAIARVSIYRKPSVIRMKC